MPHRVGPRDLALLAALALIWGSAFMFLKIAVATIPPLTAAAARVALATVVVNLYLRALGRSLPANRRVWLWALAAATCGFGIAFPLIAWGQQMISSALGAIVTASVPLFTLLLAHLFTRDEKITVRKGLGVTIGFIGVIILLAGGGDMSMEYSTVGILAVLGGSFCYAAEGLLLRRLRHLDPIVLTAMILLCGSAMLVPASLLVDQPWTLRPSAASLAAVTVLGIFSTALATLLLVVLIARVGATVTSLNNYVVPVIGAIMGITFLGEALTPVVVMAFIVILAGIYVTALGPRR